jgi:hypothetical protein
MMILDVELLSEDKLSRVVWTLHDLRDTGTVALRGYRREVRKTRRHGWQATCTWSWIQHGRRTSLATVLDTHPPVDDTLKAKLLAAWRNRYTLEA